jgi:hypothetical protein
LRKFAALQHKRGDAVDVTGFDIVIVGTDIVIVGTQD